MESVLQIRIRSEFSHIETIPTASLALTFVFWEYVNPSPHLCCPFLRILPNHLKPLIASLEQEFSQCGFHPKILGFGELPLTTHLAKILYELLQLRFSLRDGRRYILQWNRNLLPLISLSLFRHFATRPQTLNNAQILSSGISPANHYGIPEKPTTSDSKIKQLTTRSLNNVACANGSEKMRSPLKYSPSS